MNGLGTGAMVDTHEILHEGNHTSLNSPHPQYSSLVPEFITEGVNNGCYVKVIETKFEIGGEGYKEFYDITVTNTGSARTSNPEYYSLWLRVTRYGDISVRTGVEFHNTQDMPKPIIKVVTKTVANHKVITVFVKNGGYDNATISVKPNIIFPFESRLNLVKHSLILSDDEFNTYINDADVIELSGDMKCYGSMNINGQLSVSGVTYVNNTLRSSSPATVDIGTDYTRFKNTYSKNFIGNESNIDNMTGGKLTVNEGSFNTSIKLPVVTTSSRPSSPKNGTVVFDSSINKWIYYMGNSWYDWSGNSL
jgi:hypothetical protein